MDHMKLIMTLGLALILSGCLGTISSKYGEESINKADMYNQQAEAYEKEKEKEDEKKKTK